jgi:hypothetical protein
MDRCAIPSMLSSSTAAGQMLRRSWSMEKLSSRGEIDAISDQELFAQAEAAANRAWNNWAGRDWNGRTVEQIIHRHFLRGKCN